MMFEPEKLKLTFGYIIGNCKAGEVIGSASLDGHTEAEMFEYAQMAYQAGMIQSFEDCRTFDSTGCLMGNPTLKGYELYSLMCEPSLWETVKKVGREKGIACLSKLSDVLLNEAIEQLPALID